MERPHPAFSRKRGEGQKRITRLERFEPKKGSGGYAPVEEGMAVIS